MIYFTIANLAYLNRVKILVSTLKKFEPKSFFILCLVEDKNKIKEHKDLYDLPLDLIIFPDDLDFIDFNEWISKHNIVTASTGLKAKFFKKIYKQFSDRLVTYLDPDIEIFSNFKYLRSELKTNDIIITPHIDLDIHNLSEISQHEFSILKHGIFNLGFISLKKTRNTFQFLEWWDSRLESNCRVDFQNGIFTDQKWIDQVLALFDKVKILKCPGYNLATWNSQTRPLSKVKNKYSIMGHELVFIHHSGSGTRARINQITISPCKIFQELAINYENNLENSKFNQDYKWTYSSSNVAEKEMSPIGLINLLNFKKFQKQKFFIDEYDGSKINFQNESLNLVLNYDPNYFLKELSLWKNILKNNKSTILLISHGLGGGVENHVNTFIKFMSSLFNFIIMTPNYNNSAILGYKFKFEDNFNKLEIGISDINSIKIFLDSLNISFYHWHHFLNFEKIFKQMNIFNNNYGITIHDYYLWKKDWNTLMDQENFNSNLFLNQSELESYLNNSKFIITPTLYVKNEILKTTKIENPNLIKVIPHFENSVRIPRFQKDANTRFRLGILGDIGLHKGLIKILELSKFNSEIEIILIGKGPQVLIESVDEIHSFENDIELSKILFKANLDAFYFPFNAKETFSYLIGHAMRTGLPIISSNVGAIPERLKKYQKKYLLEVDHSLEAVSNIIKSIGLKSRQIYIVNENNSFNLYKIIYEGLRI